MEKVDPPDTENVAPNEEEYDSLYSHDCLLNGKQPLPGTIITEEEDKLVQFGDEARFHIDVRPNTFGGSGFILTIWSNGIGMFLTPSIRQHETAVTLAEHLYKILLPEHIAENERLANESPPVD